MGLGSIAGSVLGSGSGKKAAKQNRARWDAFRTTNKEHYEEVSPWATKEYGEDGQTGLHSASDSLYDLMFGGGDYSLSPAGAFAESQGIKQIERAASARGMNQSGNVLYDIGQFVTGNAMSDYWRNIEALMELSGANTSAISAASANYLSSEQNAISGVNNANMAVAAARANQFTAFGDTVDKYASAAFGAQGQGQGGGFSTSSFFSSLFG